MKKETNIYKSPYSLPWWVFLLIIVSAVAFIFCGFVVGRDTGRQQDILACSDTEPSECSKIERERPIISNTTVEMEILQIAQREQFEDPELLIELAMAESSLNPLNSSENHYTIINEVGEIVETITWSFDNGLYAWNDYYHPYVSYECAFSVSCSTIKTIKAILDGHLIWWKASYHKLSPKYIEKYDPNYQEIKL